MKQIPFSKAKKIAIAVSVLGLFLFVAGICVGLGADIRTSLFLVLMALIVLLGAIVFIIIFCRCPHCGGFLGFNWYKYCPHCGNQIM